MADDLMALYFVLLEPEKVGMSCLLLADLLLTTSIYKQRRSGRR